MWIHDVNFHLAVALVAWSTAVGMIIGAWWSGGGRK